MSLLNINIIISNYMPLINHFFLEIIKINQKYSYNHCKEDDQVQDV